MEVPFTIAPLIPPPVGGVGRIPLGAEAVQPMTAYRLDPVFEAFCEDLPIGYFRRLPDGTFVYVNPAMVEILGYPDRNAFLEHNVADFYVDLQDRARFEGVLRKDGKVAGMELRLRRYDGKDVWITTSSRAVRDHAGRILYYEGIVQDITPLKRSQEALRRSEERFRMLADASLEAVIVHDTHRILDCNRASCDLFGYSREELLRLRPTDLAAPACRELIYRKAVEGAEEPYEALGMRRDGSTFWAVVRGRTAMYYGTPTRIVVIRDITHRKKALEEEKARVSRLARQQETLVVLARHMGDARSGLRDVLKRLALQASRALEVARVGVWRFQDRGRRWVCVASTEDDPARLGTGSELQPGQAGQEALDQVWHGAGGPGVVAAEAPKGPWAEWDRRLGIRAVVEAPIRVGGDLVGVVRFEHTGTPRSWRPDEVAFAGHVAELVAHALLQHSKARAEDLALARAKRLERLVQAVPDGLALLDSGGRVLLHNEAAALHLDRLCPRWRSGVVDRLADVRLDDVLGAGRARTVELSTESPPRWYEVRGHPLEGGPGEPAWALVLRDVTEDRRAQEQASIQARLAAVGQLAAGIAHDFNNLLLAITGYAELLKGERGISQDAREKLDDLVALGFRAADLVRQVLDFSRGTGSEKDRVDLVPLLKETVRMLDRTLPDNVEVHLDLRATEVPVVASPTEIQQILVNLALNARDAMPRGGTLRIVLDRVDPDDPEVPPAPSGEGENWAVITVSDTGCGIPREHLERIFEPFFTSKPPGEGTGLGLAQVYGLVREHGGQVSVESRPGRGATFRVYLPLAPARATLSEDSSEEAPRGRGQTVLVVDDEPVVRRIVADLVESLGYRALQASEGREALEAVRRGGVDAVIVDFSMPGMDGAEVCENLRGEAPGLPVVLLSGYGPPDRIPPGVPFISKPPSRAVLGMVLERLLRKGSERVSPESPVSPAAA